MYDKNHNKMRWSSKKIKSLKEEPKGQKISYACYS